MNVAMLSSDNSKQIMVGGKHVHQNLLENGLFKLGNKVSTFYPQIETNKLKRISKMILSNPLALLSLNVRDKYRIHELLNFFAKLNLDKFDVIHSHDVVSLYPINHADTVLTLHGYFTKEAMNNTLRKFSKKDNRKYKYYMEIEKESIKKSKHLIVVDTRLKKYVIKEFNYPEADISVIYNAVDTELFHSVNDETKLILRKELKLPVDSFIVLVPRRYVKKNGVIYAAKAFSKMKSSDYFFIFAGGGLLENRIKEILNNNNNSLILGGIPNNFFHKYYKASDMILVPSVTSDDIEEATSLSMLEGMACSKLVVCTSIGGMKEIVKNMENGILIKQKEEDAIIQAIEFAKQNYHDLDRIRQRARKYVEHNHSYTQHAKKILDIYKMVIG